MSGSILISTEITMLITTLLALSSLAANNNYDCQDWLDDCGTCYTSAIDPVVGSKIYLATTPDFDGDCVVGSGADWTYMLGYYGELVSENPAAARCDLDGNGVVDGFDLGHFFANFPRN